MNVVRGIIRPDVTSPIIRGLVHWFPTAEAGGALLNNVVDRNNPATTWTAYSEDIWTGNQFGPALHPDGTQLVTFTPTLVSGEFATSVWFKYDIAPGFQTLIGDVATTYDYHLTTASGSFYLRSSSSYQSAPIVSNYADGQWHCLVVQRTSDTTIDWYVDGELVTAGTGLSGNVSIDGLCAASDGDYKWDDWMANVRHWNRSLTIAEIRLLYQDYYAGAIIAQPPVWAFGETGTGITGTGTGSLSAFTATGAGNIPYQATGAANLASFTSSGTGNLLYSGSAAADLSSFTAVGAGKYLLTCYGTGSADLTAFTGSGLASLVAKATGVANLSSFTAIGTGAIEAFTSTGSATLSAFTASGSGEVPYSGTGSASLSAFTADSTGQLAYKATGVADLSSFTAVGTGNIPTSVSASGAADIGAFTSSGTGNLLYKATGSAALAAFVAAGNDSNAIVGSGSGLLTAFTASSTGKAVVRSIPTWAQLRSFVANASGLLSQDVTGSGIATLGGFTASADGTVYDDIKRSYIKVPGQGTIKMPSPGTFVSVKR